MLAEAASKPADRDRFRLWLAQVEGEAIAAHIFLAAGGEVSYWLGGFDEAWAKQHPSMQTILAAIEHAWSAGDARVDLGGGGHPYKYRFANSEETVAWVALIPKDHRYLTTRIRWLPMQIYRALLQRLPSDMKATIRVMLNRARRCGSRPG
jgi:hypothetical protein